MYIYLHLYLICICEEGVQMLRVWCVEEAGQVGGIGRVLTITPDPPPAHHIQLPPLPLFPPLIYSSATQPAASI